MGHVFDAREFVNLKSNLASSKIRNCSTRPRCTRTCELLDCAIVEAKVTYDTNVWGVEVFTDRKVR